MRCHTPYNNIFKFSNWTNPPYRTTHKIFLFGAFGKGKNNCPSFFGVKLVRSEQSVNYIIHLLFSCNKLEVWNPVYLCKTFPCILMYVLVKQHTGLILMKFLCNFLFFPFENKTFLFTFLRYAQLSIRLISW